MGVTVTVPDPVPEVGESESHDAAVLTLQFKVPLPELLMVTDWAAGLLPP